MIKGSFSSSGYLLLLDIMNYNFEDLTGKKFTRLTVIKYIGNYKWLCKCKCGKIRKIRSDSLKSGNTKSCGCFKIKFPLRKKQKNTSKKRIIHNMCKSPEYKSWYSMKKRCSDKNHISYKYYGEKGIIVCKQWLEFMVFYKDMGNRPKNTTLDRIDNSKGYFKENCKWSTHKEQTRNRKSNVRITYKRKTRCLKDWADELKIDYHQFYVMVQRDGKTIKEIIKQKVV